MPRGRPVEIVEHHARLDRGGARLWVDLQDVIQVARAIQDQRQPNRLSGLRRTGAACQQRHPVARRQLDRRA